MKIRSDGLWAGSQETYDKWVELDAAVDEKIRAFTPGDSVDDSDKPYLLEINSDGVGVISIHGPLTNRDSWVNQFFGVTSYGAIREALIYAAEAPEVQQILLDVHSGGGSVAGVLDTANLIRMVNDKVKPITAFSDGAMMSAAYWLGVSAGEVYASKTAEVGSIGVIATHMERSKMLKDAGIGVTVMRSGKEKALANAVEPLSEKAKAQIQGQLDEVYKIFVGHVAEARNVPYAYADANMADGKEFLGQQALDAGLVDDITSYDELMQSLIKKSVDSINNTYDNRGNATQGGVMKRTLSKEQLLAAAAEGINAQASTEVEVDEAALAAATTAAATAPAAKPDAEAAEKPEAKAEDAGVIAMLQGQLKQASADLLKANVDLSKVTDQLAAATDAQSGLAAIAAKSVNNMRVAMGLSAVDTATLSATALLAEHKTLSEQFAATFKSGGVAAVDAVSEEKANKPAPDSLAQARLAALKFSK